MSVVCGHCGSSFVKRNGSSRGTRRLKCHGCGRTFTDAPRHYPAEVKARVLDMHLNNVGIRKIARFVGCSAGSVINWVRKAHAGLDAPAAPAGDKADVIEMDEIYTFVQKSRPVP